MLSCPVHAADVGFNVRWVIIRKTPTDANNTHTHVSLYRWFIIDVLYS